MKIALVRGAFLNQYEGQLYYPLIKRHEIVAFSSLHPIHDQFPFPVRKLPSPTDLNFGPFQRWKMPVLNRMFIDAHWLMGLENQLKGFDIAHCADTFYHYTHQSIVARRSGLVKKVVATVFENIPFNNEGIWGRKWFKHFAIEKIDKFIAISKRSAASLVIEGCDPNKIVVVTQHIDTKQFATYKKRPTTNNLTITFSGRLEFYKGVYEVILSAKRLLGDNDLKAFKLKFQIVGEGSEHKKLVNLVKSLNMQREVGFVNLPYNEMKHIYNDTDIFVAPSRATRTYQEQFSTVLLEAQACGLPIVTTGSGGIPENVENAALIANPGDFYSISDALKKFIVSPKLREEYGKKARKHVMKYDVKEGAKKLEAIYEDVLSK